MDDKSSRALRPRLAATSIVWLVCAAGVFVARADSSASRSTVARSFWQLVQAAFSPGVISALALLLFLSAFFSAAEVAFFSLHRVRLRALETEGGRTGALIVELMRHPGRLLSTILIANTTVNVVISVLLPARLEMILSDGFGLGPALSAIITVGLATIGIVVLGEIIPKVLAVRVAEPIARFSAYPMRVADWLLTPALWASLRTTELIFRVTRFNDIPPAPFMTDEEIVSILSESEAQGVLEQKEGQMIQAILEAGDAHVRELLVPRHEVVAIDRGASVHQAVELFRQRSYSRMPVFQDDLDHITGVLVAKDLLPYIVRGETDRPIGPLARRASFVPVTMTIREFIRYSQRKHMHLSIVVDEYGGTEGLVTLDDAIEEVVGDIRDADKRTPRRYKRIAKGCYRVEGSLPLDELSRLVGTTFESPAHETVGGYFMDLVGKIPEKGDALEHDGVLFTVEDVEGKRVSALRVEVKRAHSEHAL